LFSLFAANPMNLTAEDKRFQRGVEQFNSRKFFEAHETWEEIWLFAPEPEKTFLQGIIQVAAAFHHFCRGNRAGAQSLLRAGLQKLSRFRGSHCGLALEAFRAAGQRWLAALEAGKDPGTGKLPRIRWVRRGKSGSVSIRAGRS
jgi:predicted metal-dependent hydrolase